MKSQRVQRLRVQVYFGTEPVQQEFYSDMQEVSKATGMSMSELAYISMTTGFYELRETLLKHQVPMAAGVQSKKPRPRPAIKTKKS